MAGLTIDNPVKMAGLITSPYILPGDTINLRAGTYAGDYGFSFQGTALAPITIKAYNGERAIINGKTTSVSRYLIFQDIEFCYLDWTGRTSAFTGSAPADIPDKAMNIDTVGCKFINCIFHDLPVLGLWMPATGAEFYGCLCYHMGWSGPDRGHGHGLYSQNNTPVKTIKDCIIFDNFGYGIHVYTEGGTINNYMLDGNICFKNGSLYDSSYGNILVGGTQVADNITIKNCMTYGASGAEVGYYAGATNVTLEDNYFPAGIQKINVINPTETGNYYGPTTGNQVFLRANDYNVNRANLAIYNQAAANTIAVDTTGVFANDDVLNVRNVQDYWTDVQELTVAGNSITVNMQAVNRTVATPVGWTAPATTFPQFGCFVLEKQ